MANRKGKIVDCTGAQAKQRLRLARAFLEVAELSAEDGTSDDHEYANVAATTAVMAGIAAADAACCSALGQHSRGDDHHQAEDLVKQVANGGPDAAKELRRLLNLKNDAQYGFYNISGEKLKAALRQSRTLVDFAERTVER